VFVATEMKLTNNEDPIKHHISSGDNWKSCLSFMLEYGDIVISNKCKGLESPGELTDEQVDEMLEWFPNFQQLTDQLGYSFFEANKVFRQLNPNLSRFGANKRHIHFVIQQLLERLEYLGYVDEGKHHAGHKQYSLTEKGIDIALKIQEHDDNKSRFNTNKAIMIVSLVAASFIALSSIGNFYLAFTRAPEIPPHIDSNNTKPKTITEIKSVETKDSESSVKTNID
jgi:hypothetical protein